MGSIVPGAGAVPGAERGSEDPGDGSWGWGVEGSLAFGEPENEVPRKETRKRNGRGQAGRLRGRKGGVDEKGSSHRVWGKSAKVRQRGEMRSGVGRGSQWRGVQEEDCVFFQKRKQGEL